ncbi:MAG: hypothetical protein ABI992_04785, partial [Chthoniobacterales bacterium]
MSGGTIAETGNGRTIFTIGSAGYTAAAIVAAAEFRGELEPVRQELRRLLLCEHRAEEDGLEAEDEAVDAAVQEFRYERDLITAEETEQWLAERDLTLADFGDYFSRHYWKGTSEGTSAGMEDLAEEEESALHAELVFSGELGRMAERLAQRLAVSSEKKSEIEA